jgi:WD40 repeat protein
VDEADKQSVWMRQLAAANSVLIVPPAEMELIGLAFSPDGKWVALFYALPKLLLFKLAILPITGGEPVQVFDVVPPDIPVVRWSPDGRMWTYVETKRGVSNVWVQPIDGSPAQQLTDFKTDRIFRFAWSPDGKMLLCERGFYVNHVVLMSDFLPQ